MNNCTKINRLTIILVVCLLYSCSKTSTHPTNSGSQTPSAPKPTLATVLTGDGADQTFNYYANATITDYGDTSLLEAGVCWSKNPHPTIKDSVMSDSFPSNYVLKYFPRLEASATYYIRAFARNGVGVFYGNELTITTPLAIGLLYQGGVLFSYDTTTGHGMIAALGDQGRNITWAPDNLWTTSVYTPSDDGAINTVNILNVYGSGSTYAAQLCHAYHGGGYTDWYLPSSLELEVLKFSQSVVPGFPAYSQFDTNDYWSSTQYTSFEGIVVDMNTYNNSYYMYAQQKNYGASVRAIREF